MVLEDLIAEKTEEALKRLQEKLPEGTKISTHNDALTQIYWMNIEKDEQLTLLANEYDVWSNLKDEYYWRAIQSLEAIKKVNPNHPLLEKEMREKLKIISIDQIYRGKSVAVNMPIFKDVWLSLKGDGQVKTTALADLVTDEEVKKAVNDGFWYYLDHTEKDQAQTFLCEILYDKQSFSNLDFDEGINRIYKLTTEINLDHFQGSDLMNYLKWYPMQNDAIRNVKLGYEADLLSGLLLAPVVKQIPNISFCVGEDIINRLYSFLTKEIIKTSSIQKAAGKAFEESLEGVIRNDPGYGYNSDDNEGKIRMLHKMLLNPQEHIENAWKNVGNDGHKISELPESFLLKYASTEQKLEAIAGIESKVLLDGKFQARAYRSWESFVKDDILSPSQIGHHRQNLLKSYYEQKQRPAGKELLELQSSVSSFNDINNNGSFTGPEWMHKVNAYLFMDFILRHKVSEANEILIFYNDSVKALLKFEKNIEEYKTKHRTPYVPIGIHKEDACFPYFNILKSRVDRYLPQIIK